MPFILSNCQYPIWKFFLEDVIRGEKRELQRTGIQPPGCFPGALFWVGFCLHFAPLSLGNDIPGCGTGMGPKNWNWDAGGRERAVLLKQESLPF